MFNYAYGFAGFDACGCLPENCFVLFLNNKSIAVKCNGQIHKKTSSLFSVKSFASRNGLHEISSSKATKIKTVTLSTTYGLADAVCGLCTCGGLLACCFALFLKKTEKNVCRFFFIFFPTAPMVRKLN